MSEASKVSVGDFIVWLLLTLVTFGVYAAWWQFHRIETIYRDHTRSPEC